MTLPEFDTYDTIKRYAENNNNPEAVQAYLFLKRRAQCALRWKAASAFPAEDLVNIINYYLGVSSKENRKKSLVDMTEEERQEYYKKACEAAHIHIDLSMFNKTE